MQKRFFLLALLWEFRQSNIVNQRLLSALRTHGKIERQTDRVDKPTLTLINDYFDDISLRLSLLLGKVVCARSVISDQS
jgi:hypothetical protein